MSKTDETAILKVSGGSDPKSVGSVIAHSLAEHKQVVLRAVGAGAVNQAVKSIAVATQWTAPKGFTLACIPGFEDVPGNDGGTISAITLRILKV